MGALSRIEPPPLPWLFFLVAIVAAVAVGALIAYLGVTGHLGAGIPGSSSPKGGIIVGVFGGLLLREGMHKRARNRP